MTVRDEVGWIVAGETSNPGLRHAIVEPKMLVASVGDAVDLVIAHGPIFPPSDFKPGRLKFCEDLAAPDFNTIRIVSRDKN